MKKVIFATVSVLFLLATSTQVKAEYKFPWSKGYSWSWTQGWHGSVNDAIDIGTSSANKFALSPEDGTITHVCPTGTHTTNLTIQHSGVTLQ